MNHPAHSWMCSMGSPINGLEWGLRGYQDDSMGWARATMLLSRYIGVRGSGCNYLSESDH